MSFIYNIYNIYKYYFPTEDKNITNTTIDINETLIITSNDNKIEESNEDNNINIVICSGSKCRNMVFVKINIRLYVI